MDKKLSFKYIIFLKSLHQNFKSNENNGPKNLSITLCVSEQSNTRIPRRKRTGLYLSQPSLKE